MPPSHLLARSRSQHLAVSGNTAAIKVKNFPLTRDERATRFAFALFAPTAFSR